MANNRIAYGLAKKYGIDTKGMKPVDVWKALNEKGITKGNADSQIKAIDSVKRSELSSKFESNSAPKKPLKIPKLQGIYDKIKSEQDVSVEEIVNCPVWQELKDKYGCPEEQITANINTPQRNALRQKIARQLNQTGSVSGKDEFNGNVKKQFRAEIVLGLPAGGKSSVIVDRVSKFTGSRILDSDEAKKLLPEFDGGNGAGKVHKESADIILEKMMLPEYYKEGRLKGDNIVIPIVGKRPNSANKFLKPLKEAGYTVHLSLNEVSLENSLKRNTTRAAETGRYINPEYILSLGDLPTKTYEALKAEGGFDTFTKYNNDVKFGEKPKKLERLDNKGNKIKWEEWQ